MDASAVILEARRRAGLTQAQLGARLGTSQSAIARLERGENVPSWGRVRQIVEACGLQLTIALSDPDLEENATLRRNLTLTTDERWRQATQTARFILAGRAAVAAARGES